MKKSTKNTAQVLQSLKSTIMIEGQRGFEAGDVDKGV